jgi:hypothetical protein
LKSEVSYSGKDSYLKEKGTRQKEGGSQTKNIWREKCFNKTVYDHRLFVPQKEKKKKRKRG